MEHKIDHRKLDWSSGQVKGFYGKELLDLKHGGVKLVKIDEQAIYPSHQHPKKTEYVQVLEGRPDFLIDDKRYESEPGDFFVFPVGTVHSIENKTPAKCLILVGSLLV